jgi:hypothetical protein
MKTLVFAVQPAQALTYPIAVQQLNTTAMNLTLTVAGSSASIDVNLYEDTDPSVPTVVAPDVVHITLENAALTAALPLDTSLLNDLDIALLAFIASKTGSASDYLGVTATVRISVWRCLTRLVVPVPAHMSSMLTSMLFSGRYWCRTPCYE